MPAQSPTLARTLSLYGAAILAAAVLATAPPHLLAQTIPSPAVPNPLPSIKFDIVTFKPCQPGMLGPKQAVIPLTGDFISFTCQTLHHFLEFAYDGGAPYLIKGEPQWVDDDPYDFQAKVAPEDIPVWQKLDSPARRLMVNAALIENLNIKLRRETQTRPVYDLVLAKDGPKFPEHKSNPDDPPDDQKITIGFSNWIDSDTATYSNYSMDKLAASIAARMDRNVVNKTGLPGHYDFTLHPIPLAHYDPKSTDVENADFSAIIAGVKNLGLRLEPSKSDTLVLNIDHIDRPPTD
jgi:uncharacterized protein (TIGR03435 family)